MKVFLKHEYIHGRNWKVVAPSGVAAANMKGVTVHCLFQLNVDGETRLAVGSDEVAALGKPSGVTLDEYTMLDVHVLTKMKEICQNLAERTRLCDLTVKIVTRGSRARFPPRRLPREKQRRDMTTLRSISMIF